MDGLPKNRFFSWNMNFECINTAGFSSVITCDREQSQDSEFNSAGFYPLKVNKNNEDSLNGIHKGLIPSVETSPIVYDGRFRNPPGTIFRYLEDELGLVIESQRMYEDQKEYFKNQLEKIIEQKDGKISRLDIVKIVEPIKLHVTFSPKNRHFKAPYQEIWSDISNRQILDLLEFLKERLPKNSLKLRFTFPAQ